MKRHQNSINIFDTSKIDDFLKKLPDTRIFNVVSNFYLNSICKYFRVEVLGIHKIPKKGPVIIIANHSGYSGTDALMLAHLTYSLTGRRPRIMAHRGYFEWLSWLRTWSFNLGLREARFPRALKTLRHGHILIIFPEGEAGNFKSSLKRYQLQPFHTGFMRLALRSNAPVIPCIIIGAEESHLNLGSIQLNRISEDLRIPFPVNLFPLPAKWKIEFLDPIDISSTLLNQKQNHHQLRLLSDQIQRRLQLTINRRLLRRRTSFLKRRRASGSASF